MGYGYDLGEFIGSTKMNEWEEYLQDRLGWFHYTGGRWQGPKTSEDHNKAGEGNGERGIAWNEKFEYSAWEHHKPSKQSLINATKAVKGQPHFSEDRFRIRPNENRSKDFNPNGSDTRKYLYRLAASGGFAGIYGYIFGDQDFGTQNDYPNKRELQKFSRFLYGSEWRFHKDYILGNDLSSTNSAYVLKTTDNSKFLIYVEGRNNVNINLSSASGNPSAVAMRTIGNDYEEINLGNLSKNNQTIDFPSNSDWIVYISNGSSTPPPPPPPPLCEAPSTYDSDNITENSAVLSWGNTENGNSFDLWIRPEGTSEWTQYNSLNNTYQRTVSDLNANTSYEWIVKTDCGDGNESEFGTTQTFQTLELPTIEKELYGDSVNTDYQISLWGSEDLNLSFGGDKQSGNSSARAVLEDCDFLVISKNGTPEDLSQYNTLTFYAKANNPTDLLIQLRGDQNTEKQSISIGNNWTQYSLPFNGSFNLNSLQKILIQVSNNESILLLDQIKLEE